jgi:hypothetical protein
VNGIVVNSVTCLKENEFSRAIWVERLENYCCEERAKKCSPEYLPRKVGADFLTRSQSLKSCIYGSNHLVTE